MKYRSPLFLIFVTANSFAAVDYLQTDISSLANSAHKDDTFKGYVGGMSNQFNNQVGNVPGNRYNGQLYFDYHKKPVSSGAESRFTMASQVNDQNLLMYSVQEAYVAGKFSNGDELKFGRQILNWSPVDAAWGFGKINNRRNFEYFEPGQEGLIGLQYTSKFQSGLRISGFVSGLYVPELNPGLSINKKDRTITSRNAWAKPPQASTDVEGVNTPVRYDVNVPGTDKVIYRYSAGLNVGIDSDHWSAEGFFMRKPENQISAKASVAFNPGDKEVVATVTPQFYYHDVYGGTLRYKNYNYQIYASAIGIRPNTFPDGDERATRYTDIPTAKIREDYGGFGIAKTTDLYTYGLNYVARLSPYDRQTDRLAEDPRWNQAVDIFVSRNIGRYYMLMGDVKYDTLTTDRLVMLRAIYSASRDFQVHAGINMIGAPTNGSSYWSTYSNNDAVYGGLRYIF
jgi:hypothetical protein